MLSGRFITKRSFPCILPAMNASRNCTTTNIAPPSGDFNSGVQPRHIFVELKAQALGLSAGGISLATYLLNEWVCMYLYICIAGKRSIAASSTRRSFPIIAQNRRRRPENGQRPHSLRFLRLHSLHSSFATLLRPSLGRLKTEAGGCIKVGSGKLLKKNWIFPMVASI